MCPLASESLISFFSLLLSAWSISATSSYSAFSFFLPSILNSKMAAAIQWNSTPTRVLARLVPYKRQGLALSVCIASFCCPNSISDSSSTFFFFLFDFVRLWHVLRLDPFTNWTNSLTSHKQTCTPSEFGQQQRCFLSSDCVAVSSFLLHVPLMDKHDRSLLFFLCCLLILISLISFPLPSCSKLWCI